MKRYASIDFLRGLAILLMLVLHIISDTLDIDKLTSDLGNIALFQIILLVILPYLGGLAGFLLIISSMGNMVSMQKQLAKGMAGKTLAIRQILGGCLLLIFAMLSEAVIGYHGTVGEFFKNLHDLSAGIYDQYLWRFLFFETVNTIAWCIILNGIVHALITKNGQWKNPQKLMKIYAFLAVIVLLLTPLMWLLADAIVPGYPYAIDPITGRMVEFAEIGKSSFGDITIRFFLGPLAAMWEPVFPYLAASFMGSILGLYITQEKSEIKITTLKRFRQIGFGAFFIGTIGIILNVIAAMNTGGLDGALTLYINVSEHRYWITEHGAPYAGWLFQFLSLNGFAFGGITIILRLVEFRGLGAKLAQNTKFIRRLGFIAFTIYTIQWIYNFFFFIVSSLFGDPYVRLPWGGTILVLILSLTAFYVLTILWERVGYIGSLEWAIATISKTLIPGKKELSDQKWWEKGKLDVTNAFYEAEWVNIVNKEEIDHINLSESRLSLKLGKVGFLFFPFSIAAIRVANKAAKIEGVNDYNKRAKILGYSALLCFGCCLTFLLVVSLATFNISLE